MMHWGWGWTNMFGFGGFFAMFMMVAFWALVIAGIVLAVRALSGTGTAIGSSTERGRAMEILQERYARGEIDKEEYESKKRDLAS